MSADGGMPVIERIVRQLAYLDGADAAHGRHTNEEKARTIAAAIEPELVAAFKRGVQFRNTTNAPIPNDATIMAKLHDR